MRTNVDAARVIARHRWPLAWSPAGGPIAALFQIRQDGLAWRLYGEDLEPMLFPSGAAAERQARRVAIGLARLGRDAQVNVYDTRDILAGTIRYFGCEHCSASDAGRAYPWI